MWSDVSEDNTVHIGIDAFLAQLLGKVDQISYVTLRGTHRPAVVLTVNGTDLPMIFPRKMSIGAVNSSLRTHPSRLFVDPYTTGWLFEGTDLEEEDGRMKGSTESSLLVSGNEAVAWMRNEIRRASELVHELSHAGDTQGTVLMADGGSPQPGLGQHLTREELLHLFNELLSPLAGWRKS
jgi:glycine cleavage system H lipoate-binding protein